VPNSYKPVTASIDHGDPLMTNARSNPVSRNLAGFAHALSPRPVTSRTLFDRLLGREPAAGAAPSTRPSGERHVLS
jgi:pilus assembly protein CpaE